MARSPKCGECGLRPACKYLPATYKIVGRCRAVVIAAFTGSAFIFPGIENKAQFSRCRLKGFSLSSKNLNPPHVNNSTRFQLSFMMFLQYFIWCAWYVSMNSYMVANLGSSGKQITYAYGALAVATMISPFLWAGSQTVIFPRKRSWALLHLAGAASPFPVHPYQLQRSLSSPSSSSIHYRICPPLRSATAWRSGKCRTQRRTSPLFGMFGTVGWIVGGLLIGSLGIEKRRTSFTSRQRRALSWACFASPCPIRRRREPPHPPAAPSALKHSCCSKTVLTSYSS